MADADDYKALYNQLLSKQGLAEIGDDPLRQERIAEKIQRFLDTYPAVTSALSPDSKPDTPWVRLSLREIYKRSLQTAIDILRDISDLISNREIMSNASFRRQIFQSFTRPERRVYVGIWLIFLSFVLYFIDSAA